MPTTYWISWLSIGALPAARLSAWVVTFDRIADGVLAG
jgi:hypothetical protein